MERALIETELRRRADKYLRQSHLVVDYYRVRRRVAYPLPLRRLVLPRLAVPGLSDYPWATWLSWEIEERISALGWTGHLFSHKASRTATKLDLFSLSRWPTYRPVEKPDLSQAHFARTLALAERQWPWLEHKIRFAIRKALRRMVNAGLPTIREGLGRFRDAGEILAQPNAPWLVGNIRVIYAIGMALAANAASHPAANELHRCVENLLEALFQLRRNGLSEAVAYDGYILDFLISWIEGLPSESKREMLRGPDIARFVDESFMVSAPGDIMAVAELNDVEPKQMAFHASALVRLQPMQPNPTLAWYCSHCRLDWLRADALATLYASAGKLGGKPPAAGALDAHYATVLRSGWREDDVAVVIGASNSPASHVHFSNGSITIGTRQRWFVTSPGYQQFMPTSEREFTIGKSAHNTPVINGHPQISKAVQRLALDSLGRDRYRAKLDLTGCYSAKLRLDMVTRTVWLHRRELVVVADQVAARSIKSLLYHWHGGMEGAWWIEDDWAKIHLADATLWIHSPQAKTFEVQRLRGSRGQLTLIAETNSKAQAVWWIFAFGERKPTISTRNGGRKLRVGAHFFDA
jgi:hypothetical protein